ncbi:hypothetical protein M427DRAFT_205271 [Gonapodya prolifera JEL478]|uniref:Uncharacterized protein n=1 Tax=Gonapodya prolifera (strain JEL478) TaxID=1344416 RepID=A0A138ZZP2_GONPJ|nr:hypothetical protein M427DRAFT_205271 [Gonapodya prolifera JEL478]|eukprot:KXS09878.1 hypothetical protein M427DRAFT_205271 [Gonapodya prolifera JEL478]
MNRAYPAESGHAMPTRMMETLPESFSNRITSVGAQNLAEGSFDRHYPAVHQASHITNPSVTSHSSLSIDINNANDIPNNGFHSNSSSDPSNRYRHVSANDHTGAYLGSSAQMASSAQDLPRSPQFEFPTGGTAPTASTSNWFPSLYRPSSSSLVEGGTSIPSESGRPSTFAGGATSIDSGVYRDSRLISAPADHFRTLSAGASMLAATVPPEPQYVTSRQPAASLQHRLDATPTFGPQLVQNTLPSAKHICSTFSTFSTFCGLYSQRIWIYASASTRKHELF